jgi:hypothetical protein
MVKDIDFFLKEQNKKLSYAVHQNDFIRFWMNSLVVMNGDEWKRD